MAKYHINDKGEPGTCSASPGNCPFGGEANHYPSKTKAREAFELSMAAKNTVKAKKKVSSAEAIENAQKKKALKDFAKVFVTVNYGPAYDSSIVSSDFEKTYAKLQRLLEAEKEEEDPFKKATRLEKAYRAKWSKNDGDIDPEELSRDSYLQMILPATNLSVLAVENYLEECDWWLRETDKDIDSNRRLLSELLKRDMSKTNAAKDALDYLKDRGWAIDDDDNATEAENLRQAILKGQGIALTFGNQFALEQKKLSELSKG